MILIILFFLFISGIFVKALYNEYKKSKNKLPEYESEPLPMYSEM